MKNPDRYKNEEWKIPTSARKAVANTIIKIVEMQTKYLTYSDSSLRNY